MSFFEVRPGLEAVPETAEEPVEQVALGAAVPVAAVAAPLVVLKSAGRGLEDAQSPDRTDGVETLVLDLAVADDGLCHDGQELGPSLWRVVEAGLGDDLADLVDYSDVVVVGGPVDPVEPRRGLAPSSCLHSCRGLACCQQEGSRGVLIAGLCRSVISPAVHDSSTLRGPGPFKGSGLAESKGWFPQQAGAATSLHHNDSDSRPEAPFFRQASTRQEPHSRPPATSRQNTELPHSLRHLHIPTTRLGILR